MCYGVDINIRDKLGHNCTQIAKMYGHKHIVELSEGEKGEVTLLPKPKKISAEEWHKYCLQHRFIHEYDPPKTKGKKKKKKKKK